MEELVPGVPVVVTSARTGAGLDELRAALAEVAAQVEQHAADGPARLHVDRSFSLRGIGTVVTGTLWSGTIGEGDELRVEPARARRCACAACRCTTGRSSAPRRASASRSRCPGVERQEVGRGDVLVTPGAFRPSFRLDVALDGAGDLPARVQLHHGTAETVARVARAGERFAQLRLARPVVAARGDRFVLRTETTVGGGVVLDPAPARHADLARFEAAERGELVIHAPTLVDGEWRWSQEWLDELRAELERAIDAADPLDPGVPAPAEPWLKAVEPHLGLERRGAKLYRPGAAADLGERADAAAAVEAELGLEPVRVEDAQLARFLEENGRLVRVGDGFAVSREAFDRARDVLHDGITLAEFRDALGVGRKTAQLYLERFDADGVTRRVGDARVLRTTMNVRELISSYNDAWNAHDLDAICALHAPGMVFENHTADERAEGGRRPRAHRGDLRGATPTCASRRATCASATISPSASGRRGPAAASGTASTSSRSATG